MIENIKFKATVKGLFISIIWRKLKTLLKRTRLSFGILFITKPVEQPPGNCEWV